MLLRLGERLVVAFHITWNEGFRLNNIRDAFNPHRRDQVVLQRDVCPLDPAHGLPRVIGNTSDVDRFQHPGDVGQAIAFGQSHVVPEHAEFVYVSCDRLAMRLNASAHRIRWGQNVHALDHTEMHQLAGCLVDGYRQRAPLTAILDPPMLRDIDLKQLAAAVSAVAGLLRRRAARITILPDSCLGQ